jgi:hypothetical protein
MDCEKCNDRDKAVRGCNGSRKWVVGRHTVYGCPQRLVDRSFLSAMRVWSQWKRFGWPYAGGWAEQPARVFDVIEALETEFGAIEADRMEKAKNGSRQR